MTADITPENVARMLDGVTPPPWQADSAFCHDGKALRVALPDRHGVPSATIAECAENWHEAEDYDEPRISWKEAEANARFIAYAREAVPALAARVAELEADMVITETLLQNEAKQNLEQRGRAEAAEAKLAERDAENARLREALTACAGVDHDCVAKMRIARAALEGEKKS